ncbi:SpoIIE family protein phosphatase [Fodinicola feengrottensis]|uniref:SpoIIE family protein phosphatase n=1 Tax=Fodinicola feengrottensis TaxID=435914 RepID=A0ABP4U0D0_9ACTN
MPAQSSPGAADRLRQIESVTDPSLARLGPTELINELLARVLEALSADTAAVLLLEDDELVVTTARGLQEERRAGIGVPTAGSFAGQVVAARRPLALDDVSPATVLDPVLLSAGIRTLLGVPLVAADRLLGVLHVGRLAQVGFTDEDADLLQMVADRVALAMQTELSREDRSAAQMLQRSLMPARLPEVPGLRLAARYVPGEGENIGGDWYDLFTLPSGRFCVVMGDVAGHGLAAAVVMGRLRSALRAYALEYEDPAEVLQRLDAKARHFEAGSMATVLYAVFDTDLRRVRISLAGHLPPVVAGPGQPARVADLPVDPPVGVLAAARRRTSTVELPARVMVAFYTDGLVERRGVSIDAGMDALCRAVVDADPEEVCAAVMASMLGRTAPADDVALLILRRRAG